MIVAIADDFSGAVEIAGIGHRFGLSLEIQKNLNTDRDLDMIVINADTRSMTEIDAVKATEDLCYEMIKSQVPIQIFKKVDSVMRGHIVAELDTLQFHFEYDRILLVPANPSRGRTIESGQYKVDGVRLSESVFASDPIYPAEYTYMEDIINASDAVFDYTHIHTSKDLPDEGLITGDVLNVTDILNYVKQLGEFDLCCGSADCFEAFLQVNGHKVSKTKKNTPFDFESILTLNGSAVKIAEEEKLLDEKGIFRSLLSSERRGNFFVVEKMDHGLWYDEVLGHLKNEKRAHVSVAHPIKKEKKLSGMFLERFSNLAKHIVAGLKEQKVLLGLTGGATAAAVMSGLEVTTLKVKEELLPGVVLIYDAEDSNKIFLVKPGSYPWPPKFLELFGSKL